MFTPQVDASWWSDQVLAAISNITTCRVAVRANSLPIRGPNSYPCAGCNQQLPRCTAQVLLTREEGKNTELRDRLYQEGINAVEVPLIQTEKGPDRSAQHHGTHAVALYT